MVVHFKVERKLSRKWRSMQARPFSATMHQPHWNKDSSLGTFSNVMPILAIYSCVEGNQWDQCLFLFLFKSNSTHILLKSGAKLSFLPWVLWRTFPCHCTSTQPWCTVERPLGVPKGPLVLYLLTTWRDGMEVKATGLLRWKNPQEGWEYKTEPPTSSTCWLYSFLSFELLSLVIIELHVCVWHRKKYGIGI